MNVAAMMETSNCDSCQSVQYGENKNDLVG